VSLPSQVHYSVELNLSCFLGSLITRECNNSCDVCCKSQRTRNDAAAAPGSSQADTNQNLNNSQVRAYSSIIAQLLLPNCLPDSGRDMHTENHNNSKTYTSNTNYHYNFELGAALVNAGATAIVFGSGSFVFAGITYWVSNLIPIIMRVLIP
jgi:hypothetical protein